MLEKTCDQAGKYIFYFLAPLFTEVKLSLQPRFVSLADTVVRMDQGTVEKKVKLRSVAT